MSDILIADIPRQYTALAEWLACLCYIIILKERYSNIKTIIWMIGYFALFVSLQIFAGNLPIVFWIPCMTIAVGVIFTCVLHLCSLTISDAIYISARAFILAEFTASFEWMGYVYLSNKLHLFHSWFNIGFMILTFVIIYAVYYFMERKNMPKVWGIHCTNREMYGAVLVALGTFSLSNISFVTENSATNSFYIFCIRALFDFLGLTMLYNQQIHWNELQVRTEMEAIKMILQRNYQQYQMSSENIDLLKRQFHDLKHLILAIRTEKNPDKKAAYLTQMEESIALQEAFIRTENSVLDAVLTTKGIYCAQNGIKFTYLGDGKLLEFIHAMDICSIFGNALDNAIESVEKLTDLEKRLINVSIYESNGFIMIEFENYFEGKLLIKGNEPGTTKDDKFLHGYGLKSIRICAEKYGGTMTINNDDNWFILRILVPNAQK